MLTTMKKKITIISNNKKNTDNYNIEKMYINYAQ